MNPQKEELHIINEQATAEVKKDPKYKAFVKWLSDNGVKYPKIDYPVAFGEDGLIGTAAKEDIGHFKAMLFVPNKIIISEDRALNSELKEMFSSYDEVFKDHYDAEYLILTCYILYEYLKGEKSFWWPYFQICYDPEILYLKSEEDLDKLQDPDLKQEALNYKEEMFDQWEIIRKVLDIYPEFFPPEAYDQNLFFKLYRFVITRCFGWNLPCTMLIPFADCLNHYNADAQYEIFHRKLHGAKKSIDSQGYYTDSKLKLDFTDFDPALKVEDKKVNEDIEYYNKKMEVKAMAKAMSALEISGNSKLHVWNIGYVSTSDEEDNDTEGEDEEEEEEEEKEKQSKFNYNDIRDKESVSEMELKIKSSATKYEKMEMTKIDAEAKNKATQGDYDFSWWKYNDDNIFFTIATKQKTTYKKGDQVFNSYGRRTNRFLLLNYGFCFKDNKYDSLAISLWKNLSPKEKVSTAKRFLPQEEDYKTKEDIEDSLQTFKLKTRRLNDELLAYLRANLLSSYQGSDIDKIMVTSPTSVDYEILVLSNYTELLKHVYEQRFKTSLKEDENALKNKGYKDNFEKLAISCRVEQKKILENQLRMASILTKILFRLKEGKKIKEASMEKVEDEESEEEVVKNRLKLRKYLREIAQNRQKKFGISIE